MYKPAIIHKLRFGRGDRGQELLEFALTIPVLFMLILGIYWMARAYNVWQTITRAAREGARYAVLPDAAYLGNTLEENYTAANQCLTNPTYEYTNFVLPALNASGLADVTTVPGGSYCQEAVVMNPDSDTSVKQCGVQVNITYPITLAIPFTALSASTWNISTQVQMRMENQSVDNSSGNPLCPGNQ